MKITRLLILIALFAGCSKSKKINRLLSGEKWTIINYKYCTFTAHTLSSQFSGENVGSFSFDKEGNTTLILDGTLLSTTPGSPHMNLTGTKSAKYEVNPSNMEEFEAEMAVEFPSQYTVYGIEKESPDKMTFKEIHNGEADYGEGYLVEMKLEKE